MKLTPLETKVWLLWTQGQTMWEIALEVNKSIVEVADMIKTIDSDLAEANEEVI